MTHLNEDELVDYAEGRGMPAHLEACASCRAAADDLRAALALVDRTPSPEPSPLFWEHFRTRVADAVRNEPAPAVVAWWRGWVAYGVPAAAAAAVVIAVALSLPAGKRAAAPVVPPAAAVGSLDAFDLALVADDDLDADAAWAVVRTAAEGIDWEDAHAAGLQVPPGAADRMALELSEAERIELVRIVETEMKRSGA